MLYPAEFPLLSDPLVLELKKRIHQGRGFTSDAFELYPSEPQTVPLSGDAEIAISWWPLLKYNFIAIPFIIIWLTLGRYLNEDQPNCTQNWEPVVIFITIACVMQLGTYYYYKRKSPFFRCTAEYLVLKNMKLHWNQVISVYYAHGGRNQTEYFTLHYATDTQGGYQSEVVSVINVNQNTQEVIDMLRSRNNYLHLVYYEHYPTRHFPL